jgi:hypothetical protein
MGICDDAHEGSARLTCLQATTDYLLNTFFAFSYGVPGVKRNSRQSAKALAEWDQHSATESLE